MGKLYGEMVNVYSMRGAFGVIRALTWWGSRALHTREEDEGVIDKLYIDDGEWSIEIGKDVYPFTVSL